MMIRFRVKINISRNYEVFSMTMTGWTGSGWWDCCVAGELYDILFRTSIILIIIHGNTIMRTTNRFSKIINYF